MSEVELTHRKAVESSPSLVVSAGPDGYAHKSFGSFNSEDARVEEEANAYIANKHGQLTVKAVVVGCLVGIVGSFLALYYGLKTGVTPSLNILSGLGGFVLMRGLLAAKIFSGSFTPQENAVVQTAAVATYATSSPGAGFSSSFLAMLQGTYEAIGGTAFDGNYASDVIPAKWWIEFVWAIGLAFFGFFIAYPLREYMIVRQRLYFPSGTATAYVIRSMHASADSARLSFALMSKFFSIAFIINSVTWFFQGLAAFPIFGNAAAAYGWTFDWDLGSFGVGFIISTPVSLSMFIGGLVGWGILQPILDNTVAGPLDQGGWYDPDHLASPYLGAYAYTLFGSLFIMIMQGVISISMLGSLLLRESKWGQRTFNLKPAAIKYTDDCDGGGDWPSQKVLDRVFLTTSKDLPGWIPPTGYAIFSAVCILVMQFLFQTSWYMILVAIIIIPVFAVSNIQGVGRTDWDVSSSYGKIMMFPFGAWSASGSIIPALVTCTVTISGCSNAGALMQDFKTGYLLTATPSAMFYAQLIGQFFGCIITPSLFTLLNSAFVIPNNDPNAFLPGMYGPIYRTLAIVATGGGFGSLPTNCLAIAGGLVAVGFCLNLVEWFAPPYIAEWSPDAQSFSLGMLIGGGSPMEFLLGSLIRAFWARYEPEAARDASPYIGSGCIAGSGIAVVLQCVAVLSGFTNPITLTYTTNAQNVSAGYWVLAAIYIAVIVGVAYCLLYYWFPPRLDVDEHTWDASRMEKSDWGSSAEKHTGASTDIAQASLLMSSGSLTPAPAFLHRDSHRGAEDSGF